MPKFDIAYSLNNTAVIEADTLEEAEALLANKLKDKNINITEDFALDIYDVQELDSDENDTYKVSIILEVTATNKQEAVDFAVDDIKALQENHTLEAVVELLD